MALHDTDTTAPRRLGIDGLRANYLRFVVRPWWTADGHTYYRVWDNETGTPAAGPFPSLDLACDAAAVLWIAADQVGQTLDQIAWRAAAVRCEYAHPDDRLPEHPAIRLTSEA